MKSFIFFILFQVIFLTLYIAFAYFYSTIINAKKTEYLEEPWKIECCIKCIRVPFSFFTLKQKHFTWNRIALSILKASWVPRVFF